MRVELKKSREKMCFELLKKVFSEGGYSQIELNKAFKSVDIKDKPYVTRLFYGCIEKSIQFDYIIGQLAKRECDLDAVIALKMGLYLLRYSQTPAYAAIDKTVELIKSTKKAGLSGFVNALLRKSLEFELPNELYLNLSCPKWLVDKLRLRFNDEFILELMDRGETSKTHIRANEIKFDVNDFERKIKPFLRSPLGYYVNYSQLEGLRHDEYAIQSLSSMLAVKAYLSNEEFKKVLDLCASPGGKAVYLKQLSPNSEVLCCDLHEHRVSLIEKYSFKLGAKVRTRINDATKLNKAWIKGFDLVICDVPCSGFGVKGKPDIFLNRTEDDIKQLSALQASILNISKEYVASGGILCYSTCTVLKEENEDIIVQFLHENKDFYLERINSEHIKTDGMFNILPQEFGSDAFFVARLRRA